VLPLQQGGGLLQRWWWLPFWFSTIGSYLGEMPRDAMVDLMLGQGAGCGFLLGLLCAVSWTLSWLDLKLQEGVL
jgi:hypothetical protein